MKHRHILAMALFVALACLLALVGCPAPIINILPPVTPPAAPPVVIPPPAGLTGPVLAALYDGTTVRLWDGTHAVTWKTGAAVPGNGRKIAVGRTLYFLDAAGAITSSMNLPADPAGVSVVGDPVVYTFEAIDAQTALDHGALYRPYTRVWKDGVEDPAWPWTSNTWVYASSFTAACGDLVAVDAQGHFWDISRPELTSVSTGFQNIAWAWDGGPVFYFPDASQNALVVYDAGHPGGHQATWVGGNAGVNWGPSVQWVLFNGTYYSGMGDSWDGVSLHARSTAMAMWNTVPSLTWCQTNSYSWPQTADHPQLLAAYSDAANLYYVECNTGLLVSWTPQTNTVAIAVQLYIGDGLAATGSAKMAALDPQVIDDGAGNKILYYHDAGTLWRRDASTVISAFSADQQMWVMR